MLNEDIIFFDKEALLYRLHEAIKGGDKDVVFVIGAPITAPYGGEPGIADVNAVVELIRKEFAAGSAQLDKLDRSLANSTNPYQTAFDFLSGRAGQDAINRVIKRAVAGALVGANAASRGAIEKFSAQELKALDDDQNVWYLSPGVLALGALIAEYPERFGQIILTSNFDPLLEVSIKRSGGTAWRTSLSVDGSIYQSAASGSQVIHIHGFWHGTDTLHTHRQLIKSRPTLKNDLLKLLQNKVVVVIAYGGWPDIFTGALSGVVSNDNLFPEVLWACYGDQTIISDQLYATLLPGIDRNRVTFYKGIDCHEFFPELLSLWNGDHRAEAGERGAGGSVPSSILPKRRDKNKLFRLAPLECDRPPSIEVWVGREGELRVLETSSAKVVIICGIGGEGKSVLAAHYIATLEEQGGRYRLWDWRDCKEQSDRIRTQVVEIIVRFSGGTISAEELSEAEDIELVEVLIDQISQAEAVLVFDNVDSYVDLENGIFTGMLDALVQRLSASDTNSRIILTCRPDVQYAASSVITFSMRGISEDEAIELFAKRAPNQAMPAIDVVEAHALTNGHAFWLDLLAVRSPRCLGLL